MHKNLAT